MIRRRARLFGVAVLALGLPLVDATASHATSWPVAPTWSASTGLGPTRPASCPPTTQSTTYPISPSDNVHVATGTVPWPAASSGNPEDYASYLHTSTSSPAQVPSNWSLDNSDWILGAERNADAAISSNPQELCGVEGNSVDTAWQTTTGAPTTTIAILDSGIEWCDPTIVDKIALNSAALPVPEDAAGKTKAQLGGTPSDADPYDLLGNGVLNVAQYADDPRVAATDAAYGGAFCATDTAERSSYTGISPEDLIRTFGTAMLPGGSPNPNYLNVQSPAGFTDAIAGWNFVDNTNDPIDDVTYGHGTGEAGDMAGAADASGGGVGACPSCMIIPVRVGTSFIASANAFAQGVAFSVDAGASIVSEALGAMDTTEQATQAIQYATDHGVPVVASSADEESEHANLPSSISNEVIDVNSTTRAKNGIGPNSSLLINGCTNYGPQLSVTVESSSCSSEATGKTAGIVGLAETTASQAMADHAITPYPGLTSATGQPVSLSSNEILQLVTMSADDIDFSTAAPAASPPAKRNNFALSSPSDFALLGVTSKRAPTKPGYDIYSGYGRIDAARIVQRIAAGQIPPEAALTSPTLGTVTDTTGTLQITGSVAAVRSPSYSWQLEVAPGTAPAEGAWRQIAAADNQTQPFSGTLATVNLADIASLFPGGTAALSGAPTDNAGNPAQDKFSYTLRLVVRDQSGQIGMSRSTVSMHHDATSVPALTMSLPSSLDAPVRIAKLATASGPTKVAIVPEADGTINAFTSTGAELPGWPVHTDPLPVHSSEPAFESGAITTPHGEIIGGIAVGNLSSSIGPATDVVATDYTGKIYAWDATGQLLPGWPVSSNASYSAPAARDRFNRLLPGFLGAPSLADLTGSGQLDVIASGMDRHVYAFSPGGTAVAGWPVLVIDPSKVSAVDPTTNHVTFAAGANPDQGTELLDTPAIGALSGSGSPDVIVASDEEYAEPLNASLDPLLSTILSAAGYLKNTANARVYALDPSGSGAGTQQGVVPTSGAYLPGWPAKVGDLEPGLLPTIGDGATASPTLARLGTSKRLTVITSSTAGPIYELQPDGTSALGSAGGLDKVLSQTPNTPGLANLVIPALGATAVAPVGSPSAKPSIVAATATLGRLLDQGYPGLQTPSSNGITAWNARSGKVASGFPGLMNDLQFLTSPIVANVAGPAAGGYVIQGSGLGDLRAYGKAGAVPEGWPKFTGGWVVAGAAEGQLTGLGKGVVMVGTRQGQLWAWSTGSKGCQANGSWPQVHHDLANTSNLATKLPPATC